MFQEVYFTNVDWDSKITRQLKENWRFIVKFVENLAGICINRCYFYDVEPRDYISFMDFLMRLKKLMGIVFI